jgi:hypothetical protein
MFKVVGQSAVDRRLWTICVNHKNIFSFLDFLYIKPFKNPFLLC